eukprot:CAMPEP_0172437624 /NCGR_PEP_ID=MMETSP1064-20121228/72360_1 /TAXON_ID=202472 /ORGANISM="Aulacoseira subarctica , Strain CCAP 1002/5" /LENGTH=430 /DNA_ID=CAMNT_0013186117 /DNA_START=111 /DNA_END=1404 /DNA_ORIENTATION=+
MQLASMYLVACFSAKHASGISIIRRSVQVIRPIHRLNSSTSSSSQFLSDAFVGVCQGVPRLETLQQIVSNYGVPGSVGCVEGNGDMVSATQYRPTLHPYLIPISQSQLTGNFICAFRREGALEDGFYPIVESGENFPGMKLLALNSEHLMRRIACEADAKSHPLINDILSLYNEGIELPYEAGSVAKLGYGVDKYTLLRVGPFPDLYESISIQHLAKGDESSALIAAESSNGKFTGFGITFASYARLLSRLSNRTEETRDAARVCLRLPISTAGMTIMILKESEKTGADRSEDEGNFELEETRKLSNRTEETRDAARVCLRLPISTAGMTMHDFRDLSILAGIADTGDSTVIAMEKLQNMYEKIRSAEQQGNGPGLDSGATKEQVAIQDATYLLDKVAITGGHWAPIRKDLADIYFNAGCVEMAAFINQI